MDPPIGNGFRLQQQQEKLNNLNTKSNIMPSKMSTSKSKKLLKINKTNNKKVSSSSSSTTRSNKCCKTLVTNSETSTLSSSSSSSLITTSSWLRPQNRPEYHHNNKNNNKNSKNSSYNYSINNNRLLSCNLSFIVCFLAVVILNNFACFIPTTQASASAQRENTRILPLQSGKHSNTKNN